MRTRSLALLFLPLLTSACTVTVVTPPPYVPAGEDIALFGTYEVNAPGGTLQEACDFAGIDWVELVILDASGTSEVGSPIADYLWEPCGDTGVIDSIDPVLVSDNYRYMWRAWDADGFVVSESDSYPFGPIDVGVDGYFDAGDVTFDVDYGDHILLEVIPGYATGTTPPYGTCADAGAQADYFTWTLWDRDPAGTGEVPLYIDEGDAAGILCPDWIVIDDRSFDDLDAGNTYYLELVSNIDGWAVVCEIPIDAYGYTQVDCDVPFG